MTTTIRMGLIGTGRIGRVHAMSIAALHSTSLQWVADPFLKGAENTVAEFGGKATSDPRDIFAAGDVDAVIIASPTATHIELIDAAIDAGIPALCEKPIDLDISRVDALRNKVASATVPIVLGFNRRFDPHFAELQRRVTVGEIGSLEQLTITSRDPAEPPAAYVGVSGGIFRDMTIHDFDIARFFIPEITEVMAFGANAFSSGIRAANDYDGAAVIMRGSKGEMITILNSRRAAFGYDQRIEAFGSKGMLQAGNIAPTSVRSFTAEGVEALPPYQNFFLERYADAYRLELADFVEAVAGRPSRGPDFEDGRAALVLADAAAESARSGESMPVDLRM
jgi:myo-inositol 2-dehydrogenase/D-chiro-inositol 1-dehydrogenase